MNPRSIRRSHNFWNTANFRVFISHISKNKIGAGKLQKTLLPYSISAFVAHADIEPTKEWENEIINALDLADGMVTLLHKGFHESKWTDQEVGYAIARRILVISVSFGETPYGFMGRYQALPGFGKSYEQLAEEIYRIFLTNPRSSRRMAETLVNQFVASNSFETAKRNMATLENVQYWDDNFSKQTRKAVKENHQISGAWGVPEALENLIEKWEVEDVSY